MQNSNTAKSWNVESKLKSEPDEAFALDMSFTSIIIKEYNGSKLLGDDGIDNEFDLGLLRATFHLENSRKRYSNLDFQLVMGDATFDEVGKEVSLKGVTA